MLFRLGTLLLTILPFYSGEPRVQQPVSHVMSESVIEYLTITSAYLNEYLTNL